MTHPPLTQDEQNFLDTLSFDVYQVPTYVDFTAEHPHFRIQGELPLTWCARYNRSDNIAALLKQNHDANTTNRKGYTAITVAAVLGHLTCLTPMIEHLLGLPRTNGSPNMHLALDRKISQELNQSTDITNEITYTGNEKSLIRSIISDVVSDLADLPEIDRFYIQLRDKRFITYARNTLFRSKTAWTRTQSHLVRSLMERAIEIIQAAPSQTQARLNTFQSTALHQAIQSHDSLRQDLAIITSLLGPPQYHSPPTCDGG